MRLCIKSGNTTTFPYLHRPKYTIATSYAFPEFYRLELYQMELERQIILFKLHIKHALELLYSLIITSASQFFRTKNLFPCFLSPPQSRCFHRTLKFWLMDVGWNIHTTSQRSDMVQIANGKVTYSAHSRSQVFPAQLEGRQGSVACHISDVATETISSWEPRTQ